MISWLVRLSSWSTCPHINYVRWARCMFTCKKKVIHSPQSLSKPYQALTLTDVSASLSLLWETSTMMALMVRTNGKKLQRPNSIKKLHYRKSKRIFLFLFLHRIHYSLHNPPFLHLIIAIYLTIETVIHNRYTVCTHTFLCFVEIY